MAILALVAAWLATVVRWHSGSISVDQGHGMTLYSFMAEDSRTDRILRLFALSLFVLAGLLGALASRRPRLPGLVVFLLATMILYCAFWCLVSYEPSEYWPGLIQTTSPLIFTMCLGVYAGFDPTLWPKLRPLALAIAYGSVVLGAYYTVRLTIKGTFEGSNPTVEHLQIAFWFGLCALVLHKSSRWRDCVPALIPIALCIPIAIVASSRSFTLLTTLGLLTGLLVPLQHHFRSMAVKVLALGLLSAVVFGVGLWLLSLAAPERVLALKDRLTEDTRSGQYSQFFQQVPVTSLFAGLGPKATYTFNDRSNYDYVDNQFLFILFKFGLPVLLGYCAVVIWPGLRLLIGAGTQQQRLLGVFFVLWTLATFGLSIFHAITLNPQNLVVVLLAGRALTLAKTARKPPLPLRGSPRPVHSHAFLQTMSGTRFAHYDGTADRPQPPRQTAP
ncbi:MAG: hypothetical protein ABSA69_11110 [Verrucomicrobiota bacterium]